VLGVQTIYRLVANFRYCVSKIVIWSAVFSYCKSNQAYFLRHPVNVILSDLEIAVSQVPILMTSVMPFLLSRLVLVNNHLEFSLESFH